MILLQIFASILPFFMPFHNIELVVSIQLPVGYGPGYSRNHKKDRDWTSAHSYILEFLFPTYYISFPVLSHMKQRGTMQKGGAGGVLPPWLLLHRMMYIPNAPTAHSQAAPRVQSFARISLHNTFATRTAEETAERDERGWRVWSAHSSPFLGMREKLEKKKERERETKNIE